MIFMGYYFPPIPEKKNDEYLRIGFANLNQSPISHKDLQKFAHYNCDLWLFVEWNGDNFQYFPEFEQGYKRVFEKADPKTYGFIVLVKKELEIKAREVDSAPEKYACNYRKIWVEGDSWEMALLHAPPPVPTCDYETRTYMKDALQFLATQQSSQRQFIIGDLNLFPISKSYRLIRQQGFVDAFRSHFPFAGTFGGHPLLPKLLRIDYIFQRGEGEGGDSWRFGLSSSDHCGLIVDLER